MVGIQAVVQLQLPVAAVGIHRAPRNELHSPRSLVGHQIHEEAHIAEKVLEQGDFARKAAEHEASVARNARERHQVVILGVERSGIEAGPAVLDIDVRARGVVGPPMIGADVIFGVALFRGAEHRPLVAADVDEGPETPFRIARHEHRRPADVCGDEIVGLRDLGLERDEIPGALEDELLLELEELRVRVHIAMHAENALRGTVVDVQSDVLEVHALALDRDDCLRYPLRWYHPRTMKKPRPAGRRSPQRAPLRTRVAADIGGTFTDIAAFDERTGRLLLGKALSTPARLVDGISHGMEKADARFADAEAFLHGSTIAINTMLERSGAKTALLTTEGFRDIYEIGRINRPDAYNLYFKKHVPLVERALRFEVRERITAEGEVRVALDEASVHAACDRLEAEGVGAVAIMLLHCYV